MQSPGWEERFSAQNPRGSWAFANLYNAWKVEGKADACIQMPIMQKMVHLIEKTEHLRGHS
jgi:hypothetical protein